MLADEGDRVLLKQALVTFIGNLSCENELRVMLAADAGGILSQVLSMFRRDLTTMPFDWMESVNKYLQVITNCGRELSACQLYYSSDCLKYCELMLSTVKLGKPEGTEQDLISRSLNLVGKLIKVEEGKKAVANSTTIQKKLLEYFCSDIPEIHKGALIAFHASCMVPGFKDLCLTKHGVDP